MASYQVISDKTASTYIIFIFETFTILRLAK